MKKVQYINATLVFVILAIVLLIFICNTSEKWSNHFDEDRTFDISYVNDGEGMPYALLSPSSLDDNVEMPVIVWLHGLAERDVSEEVFLNTGLTEIMDNWELEKFNAYIIAPHIRYSGNWCDGRVERDLENLLDKFIDEHNVDQDKIIVSGMSLGGQLTIYLAGYMNNYFDKAVVFSGIEPRKMSSDINIPTIGYVGTVNAGEIEESYVFMCENFAKQVGAENVTIVNASHGNVAKVVFNLDDNNNGKSDVIEWMLS